MTAATAPARSALVAPSGTPGALTTVVTVAKRTLLTFLRSPQLMVTETIQGVLFMLMFRYVFGGAITTGRFTYAEVLVPGFVVTSTIFSSTASGVAEDAAAGIFDRFRSLPVPRLAIIVGRVVADTVLELWGAMAITIVGYLVGFRAHGSALGLVAALGLVVVYAFALTWAFTFIGLVAGSAQAAQGMSLLFIPFSFLSSAFVPVSTMPGWLQVFARNQPLNPMVDAVRSLALGTPAGHAIVLSLVWSVVLGVVFASLSVRRFTKG